MTAIFSQKVITMSETKRQLDDQSHSQPMKTNCYLKPAWTHNASIRTDLPLTIITKKKRRVIQAIGPGQLFCVGRIYLKTRNGTIRIK